MENKENFISKYQPLWDYVAKTGKYPLKLSFEDITSICGFEIDHSFLTYKKEALRYNFAVKKISIKDKTVEFDTV